MILIIVPMTADEMMSRWPMARTHPSFLLVSMYHEWVNASCQANIIFNKKTPEGAYAGCVSLRKNYGYVGWKWKLSSVCNRCVQERRRCSVKD